MSGAATLNVAAAHTATLGTTVFGGASRLTFNGPGTALMNNSANTFAGGVTVDGGKLVFPGEVDINAGAANPLGARPAGNTADHITLTNGAILSNTSSASDDNAATPLSNFVATQRFITIGAGGGTLDVADPNAKLILSSPITSAEKWVKSGPGTLRNTVNQPFTNGFKVTGGVYVYSTFENSGDAAGVSRGSGIVPAAYTADYVVLDGGTIKYPVTTAGSTFIHPWKGITLTSKGGGLMLDDPAGTGITNVFPHVAVVAGQTATLYKKGLGEVRANISGNPNNATWVPWEQTKLQVDQGFFRIGNLGQETGFGAVPATYLPDAIRLVGTGPDRASGGAAIGITCSTTVRAVTVTPATRGIYIDPNGGTLITSLGGGTWQIDSIISGPGGLTINGNGWPINATGTPPNDFGTATSFVDLRGANTYGGATKINLGTLVASVASAIPETSNVTIDTGATATANLRVNGTLTIGSLAGGNANFGQVILNANLTTGASNASTLFSGVIAGSGALIKTGTGTFTTGGANNYTGATTSNGGLLVFSTTASAASTPSITANANAGVGDAASSLDPAFLAKINASATPSVGGLALAPIPADTAANVDFTAAPLSAAGTVGMSVGAIGSVNYTGTITPDPTLGYRLGAPGGTLTLANANALTGARNVRITNRGNVVLAAANDYTGTTTVDAGSTLVLQANLTTSPSVTIAGTAELAVGAGNNRVLKTPVLSIPAGGKLNVRDNKVIVTTAGATGTASAGVYNGVTGLIQSGRNGSAPPLWDGSGIVTSQSTATGGNFTSIGVATAQQAKMLLNATDTATFAGQTVTGTDTLVMYTYGGDANLDGKITVDDYGRIDFNVGLGTAGWYNGDFNYDGKITVDDYGVIDFNVGIQGAPFPTSAGVAGLSVVSVPEPGSLAAVLIGVAPVAVARRRRKQLE
jgi:autotransporter-associated beta strand protein